MGAGVTHAKVSGIADGADTTQVRPVDWNADHVWPAGASFPGSPGTGDLFYRTDRHLWYFYDGTRWLTTSQYQMTIGPSPLVGTSANTTYSFPTDSTYSMYVEKVDCVFYSSGLTSGAYWVATLNKETAPEVQTSLGSANIQSGTNANWLPRTITVNAVVDVTTYVLVNLALTKTGSPGSTYLGAVVTYRLVG